MGNPSLSPPSTLDRLSLNHQSVLCWLDPAGFTDAHIFLSLPFDLVPGKEKKNTSLFYDQLRAWSLGQAGIPGDAVELKVCSCPSTPYRHVTSQVTDRDRETTFTLPCLAADTGQALHQHVVSRVCQSRQERAKERGSYAEGDFI